MTENEVVQEAKEIKPLLESGEEILCIKMDSLGIKVECKEGSRKSVKYVTEASLADAFATVYTFDTGTLHLSGTDYMGVRRIAKKDGRTYLFVESSAGRRMVNLDGSRTGAGVLSMLFPHLIMGIKIENSRVVATKIFAAKLPILSDKVPLFKFPYGNVYDDGRICWGEVHMPAITNPSDAAKLLPMFLDSNYNGDLGLYYGTRLTDRSNLRGIADTQKTITSFDYTKLMSAYSHEFTFSGFVSQMMGNNQNDF